MPDHDPSTPRVILAAVNANTRFGGEAMLPVHYFRILRERGFDAHLVCHERNREDLSRTFPEDGDRLHFTVDRAASRRIERAGRRLPTSVKSMSTWLLMSAIAAGDLRRTVRALVDSAPAEVVVHEPVPVSPRQPSFLRDVDAPLLVGPLNGGMTYPEGFSHEVRRSERAVRWVVRTCSDVANRLIDGKGQAAVLFVANPRTRAALPRAARGRRVVELVENGVDLSRFAPRTRTPAGNPRFAFVGRLVDWKRVDLLLDALARTPQDHTLDVVGDGPLREELRAQAQRLGLGGRVTFHGLVSQDRTAQLLRECDALVLPSVYECGGAVVLEAMAVGLPVVATDWGGPADYVVPEVTGVLVPPTNAQELTAALAAAMARLGSDRALGERMGRAGRERVLAEFDWERKVDAVTAVYREVLRERRGGAGVPAPAPPADVDLDAHDDAVARRA
ncbi:glycosyltransferase [Kineococcus sp. SYSU DK001]|uniref:glycosyltransferase n=1 Tax=Kineococcus sp. SYSU DK001 TaxID=3383122 RepID=UPI003D7EC577